jgi:ABC-2 type transport system permease protein
MNIFAHSLKLGLSRGMIEFRQYLRSPQDMFWTVFMTIIFLVVVWFQRDKQIEGVSLALLTLPSLLGMSIAMGGLSGAAGQLSFDREDGTLLRAKAIPQGMTAYLVSRIVLVLLTTLISLFVLFIPSLFLIDGLTNLGLGNLLTFVWVFLLGMLATAPIGAVIGSLVKSSNSGWGITFLVIGALTAISGIFYPITSLVGWLQTIGQVFPVYWLGLGVRSAISPEGAATAEIGQSWRTPETILVLAIWSAIGVVVAPRVLRRMAQRASGSDMEARKQQVLSRGY